MTAWWREHFAGDVDTHVDPAIVQADLAQLLNTSAAVVAHVDRHVAHSDPRDIRPDQLATLADVHASIDEIGSLFQRYYTLLTGGSAGLTPEILDNWQAIFRQPWIP